MIRLRNILLETRTHQAISAEQRKVLKKYNSDQAELTRTVKKVPNKDGTVAIANWTEKVMKLARDIKAGNKRLKELDKEKEQESIDRYDKKKADKRVGSQH